MTAPLMPRATAVWLVENTTLTFRQIAVFCEIHELEIQAMADGDVSGNIRGLSPYPGAVFHVQGKRVKALASVLSETAFDLPAGTVVPEKDAICIVCGDGRAVCLTQVQPEGKKPMPAAAYLAGHPVKAGFCLL